MASLQWEPGSVATVLSTELNSDVTAQSTVSAAIDNDAEQDLYVDIEVVHGTYGGSVAAGTKVADIYLLPTVDGTNYPSNDADSTTLYPAAKFLIGSAVKVTATGTGGMRDIIPGVPLPVGDYKIVHVNTSGQTLASSGNTVKVRPYKSQSV